MGRRSRRDAAASSVRVAAAVVRGILLVGAVALVPRTARGQEAAGRGGAPEMVDGERRLATTARWAAGASGTAGLVVGGGDLIDGGLGVRLHLARRVGGPLSIRLDGAWLGLDGSRVSGETADNSLVAVTAGPEVRFGPGVLRFRGDARIGLVAALQSRSGSTLEEESSSAWLAGVGAGFRLRVAEGKPGVWLDAGAGLWRTGELSVATTTPAGGTLDDDLVVLALDVGLVLTFP